jgi:hypothetical protein
VTEIRSGTNCVITRIKFVRRCTETVWKLEKIGCEDVDCKQLAQDKFLWPPNGNESLGSIKGGEFPDQVRDSQLSEQVKLIPRIAQ